MGIDWLMQCAWSWAGEYGRSKRTGIGCTVRYTLMYQHPSDWHNNTGVIRDARERAGMGIILMRPLRSGVFQRLMAGGGVRRLRDRHRLESRRWTWTACCPLHGRLPMIRLRRIDEKGFKEFKVFTTEQAAQELCLALGIDIEEARKSAEAQTNERFSQELDAPGRLVYNIEQQKDIGTTFIGSLSHLAKPLLGCPTLMYLNRIKTKGMVRKPFHC
jgi:hypothetical protein